MGKIMEKSSKKRKKNEADFKSVNLMRAELNLALLEKGWLDCMRECGNTFLSYDVKGNRICEDCKVKERKFKDIF